MFESEGTKASFISDLLKIPIFPDAF
jgi:hypothetical protein